MALKRGKDTNYTYQGFALVDETYFPHEQQKASKIHRIGAQSRGSAITDPRQWLIIVNKWLEMRWWHFQLSKNPPSWPFNGHIAR